MEQENITNEEQVEEIKHSEVVSGNGEKTDTPGMESIPLDESENGISSETADNTSPKVKSADEENESFEIESESGLQSNSEIDESVKANEGEDSNLGEDDSPQRKESPLHENVIYVNEKIDKLIALRDEQNFTDFWFYVKELNKMIFTLRGLQKEERVKFKERLGELCEEVKRNQDELKVKVARTSQIKLDRVKEMIEEALAFGTSTEEMEKSFHKLDEISKFLREGVVKGTDGEESGDMSREHQEQAKEAIKGAKDKIFDRKRELREANFKKVTERLTKLSDQLMGKTPSGKIFDGVKQLRAEMKNMSLDRPQLREIDNVIETIWKKAKEKLSTGRENDTKSKISWLESGLKRKAQFIETLEKEIKELNVKWASVQNDFFKNRVNEWIEEKKEKIETSKKELASSEDKIKFLKEQLDRK